MSVKSEVKTIGGLPRLIVNGQVTDGMAYMTYYTHKSHHGDFAARGYRLFSIPVFFGDCTINERTHFPPFKKGIFVDGTPDFSVLDRDVLDILADRPDAYIFPRVDVSLPSRWLSENTDELCDTGSLEFPLSRRECFSSDKWAGEVMRLLTLLIEHIEASPYRDNIVGYQISGGQTQEWMAFDTNGSQGKRSREKFEEYRREHKIEDCESEYYAFLSHVAASRICQFAEHVKRITRGMLVVGAFYGYTLELTERVFAHHALHEILDSPYVDFLCSPVSYAHFRKAGHDHAYMLPIDSLKLHGKLYFAENDTRTHLTRPPNDMPEYNRPVWYGPCREQSENILKMHFSRALTHGHALWWFDMWGGWYNCDEYMSLLEKMREISERSINLSTQSVAEVAVFIDEASVFVSCGEDYRKVCYDMRDTLGLFGAPYDIYLATDYLRVAKKYKAIIVLSPAVTSLEEELCKYAGECGIPLLRITHENADLTPSDLRKFLTGASVHIYCNSDAVVYANESYLFFHAASSGVHSINSRGIPLHEVFCGEDFGAEISAECGTSFLFKVKE